MAKPEEGPKINILGLFWVVDISFRSIFFGHFMLPESSFGQVMVPKCPSSIEFNAQNKPKCGHFMLPSVAILWVSYILQCDSTHKFAVLANLCFQKHKMGDDSGSKSCVSISIIRTLHTEMPVFLYVWHETTPRFSANLWFQIKLAAKISFQPTSIHSLERPS